MKISQLFDSEVDMNVFSFTKLCLDFPVPLSDTCPPHPPCVAQCTLGARSQTPHLPMSLAANSPSRDLLK